MKHSSLFRRHALRACLVSVLWLCLGSVQAATPAMTIALKQLTEQVYVAVGEAGPASSANRGFNSNAGFVITKAGVVVFDALGTPVLGEALVRAIKTVTDQPIKLVIVSHYHADHFYGLQAFKDQGAEIWADVKARHELGTDLFKQRLQQRQRDLFPDVDENQKIVPADRWLNGDTHFEMGGTHFKIIYAGPAHTAEDILLWAQEPRVLFAGDLFFQGRVPYVVGANLRGWLASMDKMTTLDAAWVVPGHGQPSKDPTPGIAMTRDYLQFLMAQMGRGADDMLSFDEAYDRVDWGRWKSMPAFDAANRLNAYTAYLEMQQETLKK
ncbi:Beta lactamase [Thiomonas sp. X19]|uniref:MBL fold metallo-hydrolase n=1 Tax=Thiomonas sp. X19 TaxID=1050370 RepID=UPI000B76897D|nr:MBL fold metallo-hydrolase [Thiomonas sp. X19]SCC91381.1 Beta lactamase [Thiomonas sp. X19]